MRGHYIKIDLGVVQDYYSTNVAPVPKPGDELAIGDFRAEPIENEMVSLTDDRMLLSIEGWSVQILHKGSGRVVIRHFDERGQRDFVRPLPLLSGTIHLQETPRMGAFWMEVLPVGLSLSEAFGINEIRIEDPNIVCSGHFALCEGGDSREFTEVISDGTVQFTLMDDTDINPNDLEELYFYDGEAQYAASGAKWTVKVYCWMDSQGRLHTEKTLYSLSQNLNLVGFWLDEFLRQHDCTGFADYLAKLHRGEIQRNSAGSQTQPEDG